MNMEFENVGKRRLKVDNLCIINISHFLLIFVYKKGSLLECVSLDMVCIFHSNYRHGLLVEEAAISILEIMKRPFSILISTTQRKTGGFPDNNLTSK